VKSVYLLHGIFCEETIRNLKLTKTASVFVCEGRPALGPGKKVTQALLKIGITPTVICDNMAGFLFFNNMVKEVILAAQYADPNGALCDMGALILAVLAKKHKVPVRIMQAELKTRFLGDPKEILYFEKKLIAPKGTKGYVPLVEWVAGKYLE
jgi:translation initiation factor 2B subunit (eIF-2B alpha/beta/delta family)